MMTPTPTPMPQDDDANSAMNMHGATEYRADEDDDDAADVLTVLITHEGADEYRVTIVDGEDVQQDADTFRVEGVYLNTTPIDVPYERSLTLTARVATIDQPEAGAGDCVWVSQ